jgi:hypothetical protein
MSKIEEACQLSKQSFEEAQVLFKNSIDTIPYPGSILGMNLIEGLIGGVGTFFALVAIRATTKSSFQQLLQVVSLPLQRVLSPCSSARSSRAKVVTAPKALKPQALKRTPPRQD